RPGHLRRPSWAPFPHWTPRRCSIPGSHRSWRTLRYSREAGRISLTWLMYSWLRDSRNAATRVARHSNVPHRGSSREYALAALIARTSLGVFARRTLPHAPLPKNRREL